MATTVPKHEITVTGKDIPRDEPLFLVRGQDKFGPRTLEAYARLLEDEADSMLFNEETEEIALRELAADVRLTAIEMRRWQVQNSDRVKLPD